MNDNAGNFFAEHAVVILMVFGMWIPVKNCLVVTTVTWLFYTKWGVGRSGASKIDGGLKFVWIAVFIRNWNSFDSVRSNVHSFIVLADIFFFICELQSTVRVSDQFSDTQVKLAVLASAARLYEFDKNCFQEIYHLLSISLAKSWKRH